LPYPFLFSADLLVVLYWLEILTLKKIEAFPYLHRLRLISYIFAAYLVVAEIIMDVLRIYDETWPVILPRVNDLIALTTLSVLVTIVIFKISKARKEDGLHINSKLRRMNYHMISMAALSVVTLLFLIVHLIFMGEPLFFQYSFGVISCLIGIISADVINMFKNPQKPVASSSLSQSSSSNKSTQTKQEQTHEPGSSEVAQEV